MSEVPFSTPDHPILPHSGAVKNNEHPPIRVIPEQPHLPEKLKPIPSPHDSITTPPSITTSSTDTMAPKPVYNSTFTRDISDSLTRCGIQVDYVNPTPLGEGANHLVYSYSVPNEKPQVIKIAKEQSTTTLTDGGADGEREGNEIAKKTFSQYAATTDVMNDPKGDDRYFVIQEAVKGKPVTNSRFKSNSSVRKQLAEIVQKNNRLYADEKMCLDFVGMAGFTGWFKKQFKKLLLRKSEFEVSNIIEGEDGKLKIIDFEYFNLNGHIGFRKKVTNFLGMTVNRILMKHYFGLDIKKR